MTTRETRCEEMRQQVTAFHKANPKVWELFDKFTRDRIRIGFKRYGAQSIFERVRWETDQAKNGKSEFKLNNNYVAFYARRWLKMNPEYPKFFTIRNQISKQEPASRLSELTPADYPEESL